MAGGVRSFVREEGEGPPVVCLHGVPASSFLYRKLLPRLADQGLRGIALDFPGPRPRRPAAGLRLLVVGPCRAGSVRRSTRSGSSAVHLVVHDIGGPIGCEWAIRNPDRVQSLTVLNTDLRPATFRRPWVMAPVRDPRASARLWLRATPRPVVRGAVSLAGHRRPRGDLAR